MRGLVLLAACAPALAAAERELDVPGLHSTELRGDALVWEDATFFLEPWQTGTHFRFGSLGGRRHLEVGRAMPVRIVDATRRELIEIELVDRADCTARRLVADPRLTGVRLFVRRRDLAPVLTRPYAERHGNGTRIRLAIGVPVLPTFAGDYVTAVRTDKLRLAIPHASVGWTYRPGKIVEPDPPTGRLYRIDRNATIEVGDAAMQARASWVVPVTEKRTDVALVSLTTPCVDLVGQVSSHALRASSARRPRRRPPYVYAAGRGWRIPAGAPISTPGGREVGIANQAITVSRPVGDTACFDARFNLLREDGSYGVGSRSVKLCAASALVER